MMLCCMMDDYHDEAEFIHRIVIVDVLRNDAFISGQYVHSFLPEVFSSRGGWVDCRDFSTSKRVMGV